MQKGDTTKKRSRTTFEQPSNSDSSSNNSGKETKQKPLRHNSDEIIRQKKIEAQEYVAYLTMENRSESKLYDVSSGSQSSPADQEIEPLSKRAKTEMIMEDTGSKTDQSTPASPAANLNLALPGEEYFKRKFSKPKTVPETNPKGPQPTKKTNMELVTTTPRKTRS